MSTSDAPSASQSIGTDWPAFNREAAELAAIARSYVEGAHNWYQAHKKPARILFRATSLAVIVAGALIPFLNTFPYSWVRPVVSLIGVSIAILTSLNSFYRWEKAWHTYSVAQFTLEYGLRKWEMRLAEARNQPHEAAATQIIRSATAELLADARNTLVAETKTFFDNVAPPSAPR